MDRLTDLQTDLLTGPLNPFVTSLPLSLRTALSVASEPFKHKECIEMGGRKQITSQGIREKGENTKCTKKLNLPLVSEYVDQLVLQD